MPGLTASNSSAMRQLHAAGVAGVRVAVEDEALALFEHRPAALELADAKLGALQVEQDRRRAVEFLFERPDRVDQLGLLLLVAVAHVDAEGVGAGQHQLADHPRSLDAGPSVARIFTLRERGGSVSMIVSPCGRGQAIAA